jgi:hypothetical protein
MHQLGNCYITKGKIESENNEGEKDILEKNFPMLI